MFNKMKINKIYGEFIGIFFIFSFFYITYQYNIYIILLLILFIQILIHRFKIQFSYTLPFLLISFIYLFEFGLNDAYRWLKTYLLIVPIVYVLIKYELNSSKALEYFLNLNVLFIYAECIYYYTVGEPFFQNPTTTIDFLRYHAFFQDSNFFSFIILVYIIYQKLINNKYNKIYVISLFLSLSISSIIVFIIMYLTLPLYERKIMNFNTNYVRFIIFLFVSFLTFIYYFIMINNSHLDKLSEDEFMKFKLYSISKRFEVQNESVDGILKENKILLGFGANTAKNYNPYGLNLHNTYLQLFFESGLIGLLAFLYFYIFIFFRIEIHFLLIYSVMFLLGNIMEVFYFPVLLFVFYMSRIYEIKLLKKVKK